MAFVAGEVGFYGIAFLAADPFCLGEGASFGGVAAFEDVSVYIAGVRAGFDFGDAFDVWRGSELDVDKFKILDSEEACVVVDYLKVVFEIWRAGTGKGQENLWR